MGGVNTPEEVESASNQTVDEDVRTQYVLT